MGELLGDGFGDRFSQGVGCGSGGGVTGGDGDCDSDRSQLSGFILAKARVSGGVVTNCSGSDSSCSCTGSGERAGAGAMVGEGNSGPTSGIGVSRMLVRCKGPMTSLTMRPRSTLCEGDVSGSISCEAAEGGGQTLSWNIEPDSDARARSRRGGDGDDDDEGSAACPCTCDDCERE